MSKMKTLREARNYVVLPEQIDVMARYLHDIGSADCPTTWDNQSRGIKVRYKGRVIAMLLEAGFTVEGTHSAA